MKIHLEQNPDGGFKLWFRFDEHQGSQMVIKLTPSEVAVLADALSNPPCANGNFRFRDLNIGKLA